MKRETLLKTPSPGKTPIPENTGFRKTGISEKQTLLKKRHH